MMLKVAPVLFVCAIVVLSAAAGCIAPPKETPATTGGGTTQHGESGATVATTATTSPNIYVTEVTPFYVTTANATETNGTMGTGYHTFATPTPNPAERSCRIYTVTQAYLYNGSAFTINLKNAPMYINYTVVPTNVTEAKAYTSRYLSKADTVVTYSTYDPQSFLEITVKSKATGEIYFQDGFGKDYSTYLNRTMKVLKQDDLLIEIKGNKIKGTVNFWVKPYGNFENPDNMTFDACTYWGSSLRDNTALALVTGTTTPTWTYSK